MAEPKKSEEERLGEGLMEALNKLAGAATQTVAKNTEVRYHEEGDQVIVLPGTPEKMTLQHAAARLTALAAFKSQVFSIREQIDGLPLDAAHAFVQVLRARYGWAETKSATKQGFFGPFKTKPDMFRVRTGPNSKDYVEVPVGDFELPDIAGKITTGFEESNRQRRMAAYYVRAEVKHEDRELIMKLIGEAQDYLKTNSIYRGKAMRLHVNDDGSISSMFEPEFVDYSGVDVDALVHSRETGVLLEKGLFTPIRKVETCRKHKVPLKRTALLWGPYGTGKTLTAAVTAKIGIENGWTFITVDNAKGLKNALEFAWRYQPAIIFAEDIDRVVEERDEQANDLLNTINGILGNNSEVITVLTTNHIEKIHTAMLRPGRIDLIVPVGLPDEEAAGRLIRGYSGKLLKDSESISAAAKIAAGMIPAMIREIVERAKLSMIMGDRKALTGEDLEAAAIGMEAHAKLLAPKEPEKTVEQRFGEAARALLQTDRLPKIEDKVIEIYDAI